MLVNILGFGACGLNCAPPDVLLLSSLPPSCFCMVHRQVDSGRKQKSLLSGRISELEMAAAAGEGELRRAREELETLQVGLLIYFCQKSRKNIVREFVDRGPETRWQQQQQERGSCGELGGGVTDVLMSEFEKDYCEGFCRQGK